MLMSAIIVTILGGIGWLLHATIHPAAGYGFWVFQGISLAVVVVCSIIKPSTENQALTRERQ